MTWMELAEREVVRLTQRFDASSVQNGLKAEYRETSFYKSGALVKLDNGTGPMFVVAAGLTRTPMASALGTSSPSTSDRFGHSSPNRIATPVRFPPGWLRLATRPSATGSGPTSNTIGMVEVAALAATVATLKLIRTHGVEYVRREMRSWLDQASERGSGDDITLGLMIRQREQALLAGSHTVEFDAQARGGKAP